MGIVAPDLVSVEQFEGFVVCSCQEMYGNKIEKVDLVYFATVECSITS